MIRAPVMMIRDPAMTTLAPAMTIRALVGVPEQQLPQGLQQPPLPPPPPLPVYRVYDERFYRLTTQMRNMDIEHFGGTVDATVAYDWKLGLQRKLEIIECPPEVSLRLAMQYLHGDALVWWEGVRLGHRGPDPLTFADFIREFDRKNPRRCNSTETEPSLTPEIVPPPPPRPEPRSTSSPPIPDEDHHRDRDIETSRDQEDQPESRPDAPSSAAFLTRHHHAPCSVAAVDSGKPPSFFRRRNPKRCNSTKTEPSLTPEIVPPPPPRPEPRSTSSPPIPDEDHHRDRDVETSRDQEDQPESRPDAPSSAAFLLHRSARASSTRSAREIHAPPPRIVFRRRH
ncbi:hypothetical protein F2Q69_00043264 [Brassica cretica]|uniref:Retrotransposon gag domain-containing protein n=1 Tax=Brassica cretica TaxID=69181 RepID=A0A8S9NSH2_BRACR|nr:hypothetical protein F2Q69_00043264 [Brassica cretica]